MKEVKAIGSVSLGTKRWMKSHKKCAIAALKEGTELLIMLEYGDLERQRDRIFIALSDLGIDAQFSETYQPEHAIGISELFKTNNSLGLINIKAGPIRWINFKECRESRGGDHRCTYTMDYGVPLTSGSKITKERILAARLKKFSIFGPVVRIRWKGEGWCRNVANHLNGDALMGQPAVMDGGIELTCYPEHLCWIISTKEWRLPSRGQWNAYQPSQPASGQAPYREEES